jgi:hypothetical protein
MEIKKESGEERGFFTGDDLIEVGRRYAVWNIPPDLRETLHALCNELEQCRKDRALHPTIPKIAGFQAAYDLVAHLHRQRAFSERTFGPGARTKGVCDHIRNELAEIEAAPADLSEWIDVMLLAMDGAWRSGATPEQIAAALTAKQIKNESRKWPDWRTQSPDHAIEHDRSELDAIVRV